MTLQDDLTERITGCVTRARGNYATAYVLLMVAVVASGIAMIAVAVGAFSKEVNAVLAALPGVALMVSNTFRFEARSDWWWRKHKGLDGLRRQLVHEGVPEADVSRQMTAFLVSHEEKWPGFGRVTSGGAA